MKCIICGKGGQGVISLNYALGSLAVKLGYQTMSSETHGLAIRGGSVITTLAIGKYASASIGKGMANLLLSTDISETIINADFLASKGVLITDGYSDDLSQFETYFLNTRQLAQEKFGSSIHAVSILLGKTISRFSEVFNIDKSKDILYNDRKINFDALTFGLETI